MTPLRTLFCRRASGEWGLASRLSDSTTMLWVDGRMVRFGCVDYVFSQLGGPLWCWPVGSGLSSSQK